MKSMLELGKWDRNNYARTNPHKVTELFEEALCDYTGASYAVAVTSCCEALQLCLMYERQKDGNKAPPSVEIPNRTYVGVAHAIRNAGFKVEFRSGEWRGRYRLAPFDIWDYAKRFTGGMYVPGTMQCVSFHPRKILGNSGRGGAILLDDEDAAEFLRFARFDGREAGVLPAFDHFNTPALHCYMSPMVAATLLEELSILPLCNDDQGMDPYSDLSNPHHAPIFAGR